MSDLAQRNIAALAESARQERERVDALTAIIHGLQRTVAGMSSEIASLKNQITMLLVSQRGSGATGHTKK